jgi:exopolysaccharide biosynthesis protein
LIGYTKQNKMIVMVVEGRHPGVSDGASLLHCAELMLQLGCVEAMNLDGGGSTCMLINGKVTIYPSDKGVERPVPAVLMVY